MHCSIVIGRLYCVRVEVTLGSFGALLDFGHSNEGIDLDKYVHYGVAISWLYCVRMKIELGFAVLTTLWTRPSISSRSKFLWNAFH